MFVLCLTNVSKEQLYYAQLLMSEISQITTSEFSPKSYSEVIMKQLGLGSSFVHLTLVFFPFHRFLLLSFKELEQKY